MATIALNLPISGLPNTTEDAKVISDFTLIQNVINGNLDANNIAASLGQAAGVNVAGQTVKGVTNIAASESRSNVAYGTLTTPDQVTVVLPANGLIQVWYQATWQESVAGAARAAIFIGANQLKVARMNTALSGQSAATNNASANRSTPLASFPGGLGSGPSTGNYVGDTTTGQAVGFWADSNWNQDFDGVVVTAGNGFAAGPCTIFAAAGTYAVGVQFKASSGSVTASGRKMWVQALSFA